MADLKTLVRKYASLSRLAKEVKGSALAMAKAYPCLTPVRDSGQTFVDVSTIGDNGKPAGLTDEVWCHNQRVWLAPDDVDRKPFEEYCDNCKRRSAVRNAVAYLNKRRGVAQAAIKRIGMRLAAPKAEPNRDGRL